MNHLDRSPRSPWALPCLLAALAAGLFARLFQVDLQVPLDDEWHAVAKAASASWGGILLSFGLADHSIPFALYYRALIGQGALSEAWMFAPSLATGTAFAIALVALARRVLPPLSLALFAGLVAVSPMLVLYARQARPYALALALACLAAWAAWRWWQRGGAAHAAAYVIAAPLALWLHLIVAPFVLGVWVVLFAKWAADRRRDRQKLVAMVAIGGLAALLAACLVVPPLVADWGNLRAKAAADFPTLYTVERTAALFAGTGAAWPALALALFAVPGVVLLHRAAPEATRYVAGLLALQVGAVLASQAFLIHLPIVFSRYVLLLLPFFLLAAAAGLGWALAPLARVAPPLPWVAATGLVAGLVALGPLPRALAYPDSFVSHHLHFMDYDPAENPVAAVLRPGPVPEFYRRLGREPAGSHTIIEAPWRYESIFNRLPVFQEVHRQRVKIGMVGGLCPPGARTEQPRAFAHRFRQFVDLAQPVETLRSQADFLVLHRALELPNLTAPWQYEGGRALPPVDACIERFLRTLGPPLFEDATVTVFSLRPR